MKVSRLIEILKAFQQTEGDQEVFITASGYYCQETTIDLDYPQQEWIGYPAVRVWSIGHSHQSY